MEVSQLLKFLLSTPGLSITGIGCLVILWLVGKLPGASFFFIVSGISIWRSFFIAAIIGQGFLTLN